MRYLMAGLILSLSSLTAFATNYSQDRIMQLYDFPNKGALTTGFFECLTKNQNKNPEATCLPAEVKFQDGVLAQVYNDYLGSLSSDQKAQVEKIQNAFNDYRHLRCDWYGKHVQGIAPGSVPTNKCILAMTMERRLELEQLSPSGD